MKFIYTQHANLRIIQRELSRKSIESAIVHHHKTLPGFKGRLIAQRIFGDKTLEVIFRKLNGDIVVITAYWLKEA